MVEVLGPGDPVADRDGIATQVGLDVRPELIDDADDLVAEDPRARVGTMPVIGMDVGAADSRHGHPYQDLVAARVAERIAADDERRVGSVVDGGAGRARCDEQALNRCR